MVQSIIVHMVAYCLSFLLRLKKDLEMVSHLMWILLCKRKGKCAMSWLAWDHVHTPKCLGGAWRNDGGQKMGLGWHRA